MGQLQIGKNGLTDNFYVTLENMFKKHGFVKVNVLKSARGEGKEAKKEVKKMADTILDKMGKHYSAKVIGFTITLKKWRKPQR